MLRSIQDVNTKYVFPKSNITGFKNQYMGFIISNFDVIQKRFKPL